MNRPDSPEPPPPPPDDEFSCMIGSVLNERDFSLTEDRRAAVLKAFAEAVRTDVATKRRVIHPAWWLAAGAAACAALWLAGAFNAPPDPPQRNELARDRLRARSGPETVAGEQLERANLRLAVLSEQLSRAEHQLIWHRAREEKIPSN